MSVAEGSAVDRLREAEEFFVKKAPVQSTLERLARRLEQEITAGEYPGDGKPKAVVFPDPSQASIEIEGIHVVTLPMLIQLKLASGLSAGHRLRDLADVQDLILALELPFELANDLDSTVREEYQRLGRLARGAAPADRG